MQRGFHRLINDLEVSAAGELLELHQRKVGLDTGGVAIHHETDRAGRRDTDRDLGVAVARDLPDRERVVPHLDPSSAHVSWVKSDGAMRDGRDREALVFSSSARHRRRGDDCAVHALPSLRHYAP